MLLVGNKRVVIYLNFFHYMVLSYIKYLKCFVPKIYIKNIKYIVPKIGIQAKTIKDRVKKQILNM